MNIGIAADLGYIITSWPTVEEHMIPIFAYLIGVTNHGSARLIFRSIINHNTRIDIMRAMLEKSPLHTLADANFDEIIDEFNSLAKLRNAYAHGLWYTHEDGKRVFLEAETDSYDRFLNKRRVTEGELRGVIKRLDVLDGKLRDLDKNIATAGAFVASLEKRLEQRSHSPGD